MDYPKKNIKIIYYDGNIKKNDYKEYLDIEKINEGDVLNLDKIDYVFKIEDNIVFNKKNILKELIKRNKNIISPFVINKKIGRPNYSMFIDKEKNKPLPDFNDVLQGHLKGCWKVTEVNTIYLIKANVYNKLEDVNNNKEYFTYIDNSELFGYIE